MIAESLRALRYLWNTAADAGLVHCIGLSKDAMEAAEAGNRLHISRASLESKFFAHFALVHSMAQKAFRAETPVDMP
jgi:hypothetical protein